MILWAGLLCASLAVLLNPFTSGTPFFWEASGVLVLCSLVFLFFFAFPQIQDFFYRRRPLYVTYITGEGQGDDSTDYATRWYQSKGLEYPSRETVAEWWQRYPEGVMILHDWRGMGRGYLSFWPLTEAAFRLLENGDIVESELTRDCILERPVRNHRFWYFADIIRAPLKKGVGANKNAGHQMANALLHTLFYRFVARPDFADFFYLIIHADTFAGRQLVRSFDFENVPPLSNKKKPHTKIFIKRYDRQLTKAKFDQLDAVHRQALVDWKHYQKANLNLFDSD